MHPYYSSLTAETAYSILDARDMIPGVVAIMAPEKNQIEPTKETILDFVNSFESALARQLHRRLATKNFHLPEGITSSKQNTLRANIELAAQSLPKLFEALLDPSGEKARQLKPTDSEMAGVFNLYNPSHPEDFAIWAPIIYLRALGDAEYQRNRAPYRGMTNSLTENFYAQYQSVDPSLHTTPPEISAEQWYLNSLERKLYFKNGDIGYLGVGSREEQIATSIRSFRDSHRIFSKADKPVIHLGFDLYPSPHAPKWLDKYSQIPVEQIYQHPELSKKLMTLFSFGSVFMDQILIIKQLESYLSASHLLKRNGMFFNDQAVPYTYELEQHNLRNFFPDEPKGMFSRSWRNGPNKFFYASPPEQKYFFMQAAGFKPELFSYSDYKDLDEKLHGYSPKSRNFISDLQSKRRLFEPRDRWQKKVSKTFYQTRDADENWYTRENLAMVKTKSPNKFFQLIVNFMNRSPSFAPKSEE